MQDTGVLRLEVQEGFYILTIDNPPVNAGSTPVRAGLLTCLAQAAALEVDGIVILGAGRSFIAGSDIGEFGAPLGQPELPQVIAAIEASPQPVCAAMHGAALGGGFELALGCDLRIAAPDAVLGLPEVTLGMMPGAGGTQRLPRLTGVAEAIALVCSGRRVNAPEALRLGMFDALALSAGARDLIAAAIAAIRAVPVKWRLREAMVPAADPQAVQAAEDRALRRGKGRPNVTEAIRLVKLSADLPAEEALTTERAAFQTFRLQEEAFALRHLFFAERAATRIDGLKAEPARVARVGVVGGGTMGQGICRAVLAAGLPVILVERDATARDMDRDAIAQALQASVAKGRLVATEAGQRKALLSASDQMVDLAECDPVIEAVFEDLAVKKELFATLDSLLKPGAILATNTSYLDIDAMAAVTTRAADVVGLHFFSPADVMTLLEVVGARATSDRTLATALAFAKTLGKQPVVARAAEGITPRAFTAQDIQNRLLGAILNEAALVLAEGTTQCPGDIVVTLVHGYGFPRWRGGPLWWASGETRDRDAAMTDAVTIAADAGYGAGAVDANLAPLRAKRKEIDQRKSGHA